MHKASKIIFVLILLILNTIFIFAHPGKTDSNGCHTCRTNCEKYGIDYGFYHRHNPVRPCFEEKTETTDIIKENEIYVPKSSIVAPSEITLNKSSKSISSQELTPKQSKEINESQSLFKVTSITDGDTIKIDINGKIEIVRLLGIDSPETYKKKQCFGNEATSKMNELVKDKYVRLEIDNTQPDRDKYGRLLRYVYLEDGTLVNEEMIKQGYAFAYKKYKTDKLNDFIKIEKKAKNEKLGLWSSCNIFSRINYYISPKD